MNGLYPDRFSADEVEELEDAREGADGAAEIALSAALAEARRAAAQREQLERLRGMVRTPVSELPFVFAPALGPEQLQELSEALA